MKRHVPAILAVIAMLAATREGSAAAPTKEEIARADVLFRDAQKLVQKRRFAEGCAKFAESQRLDPANGTLFNLALCHEREGKYGTAYREFLDVLMNASASSVPEDRDRGRVASERLKILEKRILPRVSFDAATTPGAIIALDGQPLANPSQPNATDSGKHVVEWTAPKKQPGKKTIDIHEGSQTIVLEALDDIGPSPDPITPPPAPVAPPPPVVASPPPPEPEAEPFWTTDHVLGVVGAGVGVVGLGVGTIFGITTFSTKSDRDAHCNATTCDTVGLRLHDDARRDATISTIGFIAAAVGFGAGAFFFFRPKAAPKNAVKIGIAPNGVSFEAAL